MFVNVAIDAPVDTTFDYHIPPELDGQIAVGHLVSVPFATAQQHAIVLSLHDESVIPQTKPIHALLDPRPVVTPEQIALARWMSKTYLAPIGSCLWLWLTPGLTGHTDIEFTLSDETTTLSEPMEKEIIALIKRRGAVRGRQLDQTFAGKNWRAPMDGLVRAGAIRRQSVLTPPRVRPKMIHTAALAIHPADIRAKVIAELAQSSRAADLLAYVADHDPTDAKSAFKATGATAKHADGLITEGLLMARGDMLAVGVPYDDVSGWLDRLRKIEKPIRVLSILAREGDALDVSWLYAQADCTLQDLKKLEDADLILLADKQQWRDSLEESLFVPRTAPTLSTEQAAVWAAIERAMVGTRLLPMPVNRRNEEESAFIAPPTAKRMPSPRIHGGMKSNRLKARSENYRGWSIPLNLYKLLKPLTQELRLDPTPAERFFWQQIRHHKLDVKFKRQHSIERFIVDFYASELRLVIEIGGGIPQYTQDQDAIRHAYLESLGLRVIRFGNDEVFHDADSVLTQLHVVIQEQTNKKQPPFIPPLPEFGEGTGEGLHYSPAVFLLHGVTGSGKTEIYLRAIDMALKQGRSALFLVPEIALTPQTVRRVAARFPGRVAVVHSRLSDGERYDTWRRSRDGLVQVVVGARSALFSPLPDIGVIILDESHDTSYKQSPPIPPPYYHVRQVAEEMIKQNGGVLIMGSATPDIESAYRAERGEIRRLELAQRIMGHKVRVGELGERAGVLPLYHPESDAQDAVTIDLPPVLVVDMRDELKAGNTSIFSEALQEALADVLQRRQQAILFLNRRGQATYVFCRDCGYVAKCPRCDSPLTHHRTGDVLRCHRCSHTEAEPTVCPSCGSRRIKYFGAGTQQVETALAEMFPRVRIARWDADTADSPEAHEAILQRFIDRKTDVMIGTQMVTKGLDLPLVTLVGVISADVGINLPDFRAGEKTFQVLTQVAGRAGRGLLGGQVILQTYMPEHYAIQAASRHDFHGFYAQEIAYRKHLGYPPFRRMIRILFRFPTEMQAQSEAERAAGMIRHRLKALDMSGTELIGPAPCFFARENKLFRWHVLLRGPDPAAALDGLKLPKGWFVDVDPVDVL